MMRKKLIFTILMCLFLGVTQSKSQNSTNYDWNPVIDAIIQVESKGNPKAHNKNGDCVGILQITKVLVKEVNNSLKLKGSTKRYTYQDRWDVEKSKEMFIIIQERFNKQNNVEKAIRGWNGGMGNWKTPKTLNYYKKVMKYYNKKGSD